MYTRFLSILIYVYLIWVCSTSFCWAISSPGCCAHFEPPLHVSIYFPVLAEHLGLSNSPGSDGFVSVVSQSEVALCFIGLLNAVYDSGLDLARGTTVTFPIRNTRFCFPLQTVLLRCALMNMGV
jgi:hypothetical protein